MNNNPMRADTLNDKIKDLLKNGKITDALDYLNNFAQNEQLKEKVNHNIVKVNNIESDLFENRIDFTEYTQRFSKVILSILDITDSITGDYDIDIDFIDEIKSSLKFKSKNIENVTIQNQQSVALNNQQPTNIESLKLNILKLTEQLHKYEDAEKLTQDPREIIKYRDISEALKNQIFDYSKQIKDLSM